MSDIIKKKFSPQTPTEFNIQQIQVKEMFIIYFFPFVYFDPHKTLECVDDIKEIFNCIACRYKAKNLYCTAFKSIY